MRVIFIRADDDGIVAFDPGLAFVERSWDWGSDPSGSDADIPALQIRGRSNRSIFPEVAEWVGPSLGLQAARICLMNGHAFMSQTRLEPEARVPGKIDEPQKSSGSSVRRKQAREVQGDFLSSVRQDKEKVAFCACALFLISVNRSAQVRLPYLT